MIYSNFPPLFPLTVAYAQSARHSDHTLDSAVSFRGWITIASVTSRRRNVAWFSAEEQVQIIRRLRNYSARVLKSCLRRRGERVKRLPQVIGVISRSVPCQRIERLFSSHVFLPLAGATMRGRKGSGQTGSSAIPARFALLASKPSRLVTAEVHLANPRGV